MSGIYIHIPFCKQACYYCNFHFSTSRAQQASLVNGILQEITLQQHYLGTDTVHTIYFGGGTPSLLEPAELTALLEKIRSVFSVAPDAEITLEANPDDLSRPKLEMLKAAGINRLSIGVQSFHETDLTWMNRAHNSGQALACIQLAQELGFQNITIDLIYGGPTLSDEGWEENVKQAIALGIPHLSCYALTVEPGTALDHFIRKKKMAPTDADKAARHFELLMQWLKAAGYEHYEISNFALPGWHSRHNSSYWQGKPYLGLGPSAHSFNGHSRQWNIANNAQYIKSITAGAVPFEIESLTSIMVFNEYIMTSLRTAAGCNLEWVAEKFDTAHVTHLLQNSTAFINDGKMERVGETLRLTPAGRLFADGIAAALFL
ncbi:radical SAM family heme chaperone HemW [Chitinophaga nivalis]|uniref:Heme chaperone HemW n=1 Tax=Chitinophaga nivalis TaxID=2991709 RepID=A0ABT3IUG6_9BACT|nr:radical SAM family heme chaperone HemW [Chitinophaga nivalis]MCW3462686.1 radical SAM family heme chaperone HemW [Chitinophaga nivalis]MCW3487623.1 radical SAM family heme chaperone HemW [Chitinophaga nivalis]